MSEHSASPSGKETVPPVEDGNSVFREGLDAMKKGNYDLAADFFGELLHQNVEKHGELSAECALPGYYYGVALLNVAQASREVFTAKEDAVGESSEVANEESPSDLALAWEALECARHNFERDTTTTDHSHLAGLSHFWFELLHLREIVDVFVALGDVACETGNFESALKEYKEAILHLEQCPEDGETSHEHTGGMQRRFCEVYYKMCLGSEFLEDPTQAGEYCDKAISAIRQELQSAESSSPEAIPELREIEKDLVERKEAIEISLRETEQVKEFLRQMLQQAVPEAEENKTEETPVDLGIVGRGKNRIRANEKTELQTVKEESVTSPPRKRDSDVNKDNDERSSKKTKLEGKSDEA